MWIAATPDCSYFLTVRPTLSKPPYPVSASAITGTLTDAVISAALDTISVIDARAKSGNPYRATDVPAPVIYTAGNPDC